MQVNSGLQLCRYASILFGILGTSACLIGESPSSATCLRSILPSTAVSHQFWESKAQSFLARHKYALEYPQHSPSIQLHTFCMIYINVNIRTVSRFWPYGIKRNSFKLYNFCCKLCLTWICQNVFENFNIPNYCILHILMYNNAWLSTNLD